MPHLVWLPPDGIELLGKPPDGIEIAPFPDDPLSDPRIGKVEAVVPWWGLAGSLNGRPLADLWSRMPRLRLIQTLSAGVDWIVESVPSGVVLCSARGAHDVPVSEWVLAAILSDVKNLAAARDHQREESWVTEPVGRLEGSTVLLLGYGSIARAVEGRLQPFGARILRIARRPREGVATMAALPELLPQTDVVVILLALTPETARTVDATFLRKMKPGALLVNAARGRLVDTGALLEALENGRVRAVLDVTDPEPLPDGHPLWRAPGVLITAHVGGNTADWQKTAYVLVRAQLQRWVRGEPLLNVVEAGY